MRAGMIGLLWICLFLAGVDGLELTKDDILDYLAGDDDRELEASKFPTALRVEMEEEDKSDDEDS